MRDGRIACSIALLLWAGAATAQNQTPVDVQRIADTMVRLCLGGGQTQATTGTATGGADISLRSLDVRGNLTGEFKISKSSAEGLVGGIDNALTQVASDQADKVRVCLQPVRERLLDVLLPAVHSSIPNVQANCGGVAIGGSVTGTTITGGTTTSSDCSTKPK
jgi:hypothetical protein